MTSQKYVRLLGDAGRGPALIVLRSAETLSKAAAVLAADFRVVSIAVDAAAILSDAVRELAGLVEGLKITELGLIADSDAGPVAIAFAAAHPEMVQSVALLSPVQVGDASTLKAPVLALFGTIGAARAPEAPKALVRSIPNCRLVYVYDADGAVDDERPEAVAAALQDFAIRREGYLVNAKRGNLYP